MNQNSSNAIFQLPTPAGAEIREIKAEIEVPRDEAKELLIKQKLFANLRQTKELIRTKIEFAEPLVNFDNYPILYPGAITVIQGKKGSMKSRITESIVTSLIANQERVSTDFERKPDEDYFVIFFDTERHTLEQFPKAMQSIVKAAGYNCNESEYESHFAFFSLIEYERNTLERFHATRLAIEHYKQVYPNKRMVIVVDVCTDLIGSFNSIEDTNQIIDYINILCNKNNASFIATIHENKADNNSRGHLGSEITNKASVVARVESDRKSNIVKFSLMHTRSHKEPDAPFYFEFDESTKLLKRASIDEAQKVMLNSDEVMQSIIGILSNVDKLNRADICQQVKEITKKSEKTIDTKLKNMASTGILFAEKIGSHLWYGLVAKPIEITEEDEAPLF